MAGRRLEALALTEAEKSELIALAARPKTAQALAERARIVLACTEGLENKAVCRRLEVHPQTVGKWRSRFLAQRVEGLRDDPRPGAPRPIEDERIAAVITRTLESQPQSSTHWSSRGMARQSGLSVSTVQRIWRAETASTGDVQTLHRSGFCCQGTRCGGSVSCPSRACGGAQCRREVADTGA